MKKTMIAATLTLGLATQAWAQAQPIPRAEFLSHSKEQFAAADADHDGALTKVELAAAIARAMGSAPPPEILDRIFAGMDTNGDGKATAAEIEAHDTARFDLWDTNHDGILTPDEIMAGRAAMQNAAPKPQ
ncbi:MAG TPA: EF-hand domain-containing protein [Sphingomonas sp.]|uniref:EF-hand domain-containing protein n=1 Tax=Sphingomonas sp. TaxID=28214 RepID=UPI002CAD468A|nr:EF-hand domain-containing protein [Sphingomonas sp.]HMI19239.1 EF-hand domain-containing protein [Sphingomonas sp.]